MLRDCPKAYAIKAAEVAQKKSFFFSLTEFSLSLLWPRAGGYFIQTEAAASFGLHKKRIFFFSSFFLSAVVLLLPPLVCKVVSIFLPFVIGCKRVGICLGDTRGNYIAKAV